MPHPDIEELSSPDEPSVSLPCTSSHEAVLRVSGTRSEHRTTIRVSGYVCKRCQPLRRPWWQICQSRRLGLVFSLWILFILCCVFLIVQVTTPSSAGCNCFALHLPAPVRRSSASVFVCCQNILTHTHPIQRSLCLAMDLSCLQEPENSMSEAAVCPLLVYKVQLYSLPHHI